MNTGPTLPSNIAEVLNHLTGNGLRISDNALAEAVGLPQPTISRLRNGTTLNPQRETVARLASHFRLTLAQMRGDEPLPEFNAARSAAQHAGPGYTAAARLSEAQLIEQLIALDPKALNRVMAALAGHLAGKTMTNGLGQKSKRQRATN